MDLLLSKLYGYFINLSVKSGQISAFDATCIYVLRNILKHFTNARFDRISIKMQLPLFTPKAAMESKSHIIHWAWDWSPFRDRQRHAASHRRVVILGVFTRFVLQLPFDNNLLFVVSNKYEK